MPLHGRQKDVLQYGEGLIVNIPLPEPEVADVVEEEARNTIIRSETQFGKCCAKAELRLLAPTALFPSPRHTQNAHTTR